MKDGKRLAAIVLAAGSGKRMGTNTPKQFLEIKGKPLLYYCLKIFEDSFIDEIIIVCRNDDREFVLSELVNKYSFSKVTRIVEGGKERYHSVAAGLEAVSGCDYVFVHDGARPFVSQEIIENSYSTVDEFGSAITSVPAKDTVKLATEDGYISSTPNRNSVYLMQTPQTFDFACIRDCYRKLIENEEDVHKSGIVVTDDAMVMEYFTDKKVKLSKGDYRNIKITTPEDLKIAGVYMEEMGI